MQDHPWDRFSELREKYHPLRQLGQATEGAIRSAKDRANGAIEAADLALRGRALTRGEIMMCQAMFGTTAGYERARVFPYHFWWPAPFNKAMAPNGNIYFPSDAYRDDYGDLTVPLGFRALFMHEGTHLYQWYVLRQWVWVRGAVDRNYNYTLVPGQTLKDYGLEEMGQIVEDYYRLTNGGRPTGPRTYRMVDYRDALPVRR